MGLIGKYSAHRPRNARGGAGNAPGVNRMPLSSWDVAPGYLETVLRTAHAAGWTPLVCAPLLLASDGHTQTVLRYRLVLAARAGFASRIGAVPPLVEVPDYVTRVAP